MKTKFIKFILPIGLGISLTVISIMGLVLTTFTSCDKLGRCTNKDYPLYCSQTSTCCPAGYAYLCDGKCYSDGCPSTTVNSYICSE